MDTNALANALAVEKSVNFAAQFNKALKSRGKSTAPVTTAQLQTAQANPDLGAKFLNAYSNKGSKAPVEKAPKKIKTTSDGLTAVQRFNNLVADANTKKDAGLFSGLVSTAKSGFGEVMKSPVAKFIERPLDIVSRPAYAVDETLLRAQKDINANKSLWDTVTDPHVYGGALAGLSGHSKTGYGQVLQEAVNGTKDGERPKAIRSILPDWAPYGPDVLHGMEQTNPDEAKWIKRVIGGVGDVATDPTTYVSVGTTELARGAEGADKFIKLGAENIGKTATQDLVEKTVQRAVKDTPIEDLKSATGPGINAKKIPTTQKIIDAVNDKVDELTTHITAGAQKGKAVGTKEALDNAAQQIAATSEQALRDSVQRKIDAFTRGEDPTNMVKKWSPAKLAKEKETDPIFKEFIESGVPKENASALLNSLIKPHIDQIRERALEGFKNQILKVPTIEIHGKQIASFPKLGELANKLHTGELPRVGRSLDDLWHSGFGKAFSYTSNFPGATSLIESRARTLGISQFEKDAQAIQDVAKGVDGKARKALQLAMDGEHASGDLHNALQRGYSEAFNSQLGANVVDAEAKHPNYSYIHIKSGAKDKIAQFYKERADATKFGTPLPGIARAKQLGLQPEEDALVNYLQYLAKSNQKVTNSRFLNDLAAQYGIRSQFKNLPNNLIEFNHKYLDKTKLGNDKLYLDRNIKDVADRYLKFQGSNDEGAKALLNSIDFVNRKFKTWNTVYFPGYHIKNFLSDMYLGALDGVGPSDYHSVFNLFHKKDSADLALRGAKDGKVKYSKLLDDYHKNAGSGFVSTEAPKVFGAGKITNKIHGAAEAREDLGRFAHFYHAMKEEYPAALSKIKSTKLDANGVDPRAYEKALQASVFRVNKYKFDFQALTPVEKNGIRRGVPFYTYARKAIPTIIESLFLNPKELSYTNRIQNALGQGNAGLLLPQWMRDIGYSEVVGGQNGTGWGVTNDLTPQATLQQLDPRTFASQVTPLAQVPFELKTGKDTFTGRKITSPTEYATNHLRAASVFNKATNHTAPWSEQFYQFMGLPIRQITKGREASTAANLRFLVTSKVGNINKQIQKLGYKAYISNRNNGIFIRISDTDGNVVGEYGSYKELKDAVKNLK